MSLALGWPRERVPECSRTLVAEADAVWIWPGIPLTRRRGAEIVPVAAETIRFWITRLHGPDALDQDILRAVASAAQSLAAGDESAAQTSLDALGLAALSYDGAALMRAVAAHLGMKALDMPLRVGMRTWSAQDIAQHLSIFKRHADAARVLAKGIVPFDPQKHPRWPAGTPDSQGGEFAPGEETGAAVIPVASRGNGKPPERGKPKKPSPPLSPDTPGVRYLDPSEFPDPFPDQTSLPPARPADLAASPDARTPNLLGPEDLRPGIGHNSGDPTPLDGLPDSPPQLPAQAPAEPPPELAPQIPPQLLSVTARNLFIKAAVRWIARALILAAAPDLGPYLIVLQTAYWVRTECWPYIKAYFQVPKTWAELQADALKPLPGYDIHHPVEQTPARLEGYPESVWDGPGNRLRIPTLKHWQITGWYMTPNEDFDGLSPREYLKGKSWEEKARVGRDALILFGVLKP